MAPTGIDLTARTRTARVLRSIGFGLTLLFAAGCLASLVAGPETLAVRLVAGAVGLLIVLLLAVAAAGARSRPHRLFVDHKGIRVVDRRGRDLVLLAWAELAGVGVMTNELARRRQLLAAGFDEVPWLSRRMVAVSIWLELYPADADAVARHPELHPAWVLGAGTAPGEERRWLVSLGDGHGQEFPIGEAVQRWRPELWRGHRSGSFLLGGHAARNGDREIDLNT